MSPGLVRSNLRGPSEEARSGWGKAGDPEDSGQIVLDIVQGRRDADTGRIVHKDGVVEIWPPCWNLAMLDFGGPIGFPAFSRISHPFCMINSPVPGEHSENQAILFKTVSL